MRKMLPAMIALVAMAPGCYTYEIRAVEAPGQITVLRQIIGFSGNSLIHCQLKGTAVRCHDPIANPLLATASQ